MQRKGNTVDNYASITRRFAALVIDSFIISFVVGMVLFLSGILPYPSMEDTAIGGIATWLYHALFESSCWQGTPGKKMLGIYVADMRGSRISFGRATIRFFAKLFSAFILYIGFVMALFTQHKQALHDIVAGTLVLRAREL